MDEAMESEEEEYDEEVEVLEEPPLIPAKPTTSKDCAAPYPILVDMVV